MNLPIYILAGGRSVRFGTDKARAMLDDRPLLVRLAEQVAPVASRVVVVAERADEYADLGLTTIADREPGLGPMGGLLTALHHARAAGDAWVLISACDQLELRPTWLEALWRRVERDGDVRAVAFHDERWQPMPGLYRVGLIDVVEAMLREGDRALWRLLTRVGAAAVAMPDDWPAVAQANTPAELEAYRRQHGDR